MSRTGKTIYECRLCAATTHGSTAGEFFTRGWGRILNIDGPNAICPVCSRGGAAPLCEGALLEEYPNAAIADVPMSYISEDAFDTREKHRAELEEDAMNLSRLRRAADRVRAQRPITGQRPAPVRPQPPAPDAHPRRLYVSVTGVDTGHAHHCSVTLPPGISHEDARWVYDRIVSSAPAHRTVWLEEGVRGPEQLLMWKLLAQSRGFGD